MLVFSSLSLASFCSFVVLTVLVVVGPLGPTMDPLDPRARECTRGVRKAGGQRTFWKALPSEDLSSLS